MTRVERQGGLGQFLLQVSAYQWESQSNGGKCNPFLDMAWKPMGQSMPKSEEDAGYLCSQAKGPEMLFLNTKHLKSHPCLYSTHLPDVFD